MGESLARSEAAFLLLQSWADNYNCYNYSMITNLSFCIFYQIDSPFPAPVLLEKPTPSQINLTKNAKNLFFIIEKNQKYRKCPALVLKIIIQIGKSDICRHADVSPKGGHSVIGRGNSVIR